MTDTVSPQNHYRHEVFQLKHWQIHPLDLTIASSEKNVKVPHNVMQLLLLLADNYGGENGGIVSRQQIMQSLWPDTVVTDESISRVIADLRKYLGDSARHPKFINTISKQGYNLLVEPVLVGNTEHSLVSTNFFANLTRWLALAIFLLIAVGAAIYWPVSSDVPNEGSLKYVKTKLAVSGNSNRHPRIDRDGRYVVFDKMLNSKNEIWLYDVQRDTEHTLFSSPTSYYKRGVFSNSGSELAFVESSIVSENKCEISVLAFKTQKKKTVTPCNDYWITTVDWSSDDTGLIATFQGEQQGTAGFSAVNIANGGRESITYPDQKGTGHMFHRVSRSGNKIAFIHFEALNNVSKIGIWDAATKKTEYISMGAHQIQQVTWGKDDKTLLYSDISDASSGIWQYVMVKLFWTLSRPHLSSAFVSSLGRCSQWLNVFSCSCKNGCIFLPN